MLDLVSEKEKVSDELYEMTEKLEDYAVEIRYPDDWFEPGVEDAEEALEIARKVKEFVLSKVVDALCYTPEEFKRKKQQIGVVREAVEKGIRLV